MTPTMHPGKAFVREMLARDWNLSEAAKRTGIDSETLLDICQEGEDVTPETAAGLEKATGISATFWLNLQLRFDAAEAGATLPTNLIVTQEVHS